MYVLCRGKMRTHFHRLIILCHDLEFDSQTAISRCVSKQGNIRVKEILPVSTIFCTCPLDEQNYFNLNFNLQKLTLSVLYLS